MAEHCVGIHGMSVSFREEILRWWLLNLSLQLRHGPEPLIAGGDSSGMASRSITCGAVRLGPLDHQELPPEAQGRCQASSSGFRWQDIVEAKAPEVSL